MHRSGCLSLCVGGVYEALRLEDLWEVVLYFHHVGSKDKIIRFVTRRGGKSLLLHCALTNSGPGTFILSCKHHQVQLYHYVSITTVHLHSPFCLSELKFFTQ